MRRLALVTGGTRGIGGAIAIALQDAGFQVVATYHGHEETANAFQKAHDIKTYKWDVSNYEACQQGVSAVQQAYGPIEVLVNNAGITRDALLHKMTPQQWQEVISTNLTSCFNMCAQVVPSMREARFGRIINMSSINALKGQRGQSNYAAAKAGMLGFTKSLAQENATYGITVNALAPGYINTEMVQAVPQPVLDKIIEHIPIGRLGEPSEVARAVVFLASDEASCFTGATLQMNGGQYMG